GHHRNAQHHHSGSSQGASNRGSSHRSSHSSPAPDRGSHSRGAHTTHHAAQKPQHQQRDARGSAARPVGTQSKRLNSPHFKPGKGAAKRPHHQHQSSHRH